MLRVPSLKPNMLRGVCASGVVEDVLPKPSCDQRTATLPKPIRARLRIACTATCGSSAQAWTHRSPPLRAGSRLSPGNVRQVDERRRGAAPPGRTGPSSNRRGPKPMSGSAGTAAGRAPRRCRPAGPRRAPPDAPSPTAPPGGHPRGRLRPVLEQRTSSARSSVVTSNAAKCSRSCTGVAMPAWCAPWNGDRAPRPAAAGSASSPVAPAPAAPPAAAAPSASPAPPQPTQRATARVGGRRAVLVRHGHARSLRRRRRRAWTAARPAR